MVDQHHLAETDDQFSEYHQKIEHKQDMRNHLIAFALSIIFTLFAFYAVANADFSNAFKIPFILGLAVVQAGFQLYIWMHLSGKGHRFPAIFMYGGMFAAIVTVLGLVYLNWW
jgi:cytochrome c oxidase subunit 4